MNKRTLTAIKKSPAGMFPAAAASAGISMGSKLGQAITKSPAGKIPKPILKAAMKAAGTAMALR